MRESLSQNPLSSQTNRIDDNEIDSKLFIGKASADPDLTKRQRYQEIKKQIIILKEGNNALKESQKENQDN